jgi:F-box/leucine-rich repeat protein 7
MADAPLEWVTALSRSVLFFGTPTPDLEELVKYAQLATFEPESNIIAEGDLIKGLHVLLEGSVEIEKHDHPHLATMKAGNFFGEISIFGNSITATATVVARAKCTVMIFKREQLNIWLKNHVDSKATFFANLSSELCDRLHSTTEHFLLGHPVQKS